MRFLVLVAMAAMPIAAMAQQGRSPTELPPGRVLLTLYSPHGPIMLEWPGRKSWAGRLWVDHQKIGLILPGQFLTLKLPEGDHSLAGQSGFAHESSISTIIPLHKGERYFMRLIVNSRAVAGFDLHMTLPSRSLAKRLTARLRRWSL